MNNVPGRRLVLAPIIAALLALLAAVAAPSAAGSVAPTGGIAVWKGGYRNVGANDAKNYALPLAGAGFEYSADSGFTSPKPLGGPTDATGYSEVTGVPGASTGAGVQYWIRESSAPSGWSGVPQISWTTRVKTSTATAQSGSLQRVPDVADNPVLSTACGRDLKVLLLLDTSGSTSGYNDDYRHAAKTFVDTLAGTRTTLKISSFATESKPGADTYDLRVAGGQGQIDANARLDAIYPTNTSGSGMTNWDAAMQDAAKADVDVVVFVTDGNPTIHVGGESSPEDLAFGIASANLAKHPTMGKTDAQQRILGVGVGGGISVPNIVSMSGPKDGTDYAIADDPTELAKVLAGIASSLCPGTLEVRKSLAPAGDPGRFDLLIDGSAYAKEVGDGGTTGAQSVAAGLHTVSETGHDGTAIGDYDASVQCVNASSLAPVPLNGGTPGTKLEVDVKSNEDVVCTFTNTYRTPKLHLVKKVDDLGLTGDMAAPTDFTLSADGSTKENSFSGVTQLDSPATLRADTWTLGESADPRYSAGKWSCDGGSQDGAKITLAAGEEATCTIVNTRLTGTVELVKSLIPATDAGRFDLSIDGSVVAAGVGDKGTSGPVTVATGTHAVAEAAADGTSLSDYSSGVVCLAQPLPTAPVGKAPTYGTDVAVGAGDTVVCTFANSRHGTLEVVKSLSPTTDTGLFDLSIAGDGVATSVTDVGNGGTTGAQSVPAGSYTVAEAAGTATSLAGYTSKLTCLADGQPMTGLDGITATSAKVGVEDGQTVVCTFANAKKPSVLPPTPSVLPPASVRGIATMRAPEGCVLPGVIRTRIAGLNIRWVRFYRDGVLVKRVHNGTARHSVFVLRTRVRADDFALHTVRVRVRFIAGATPRSKTFLHRFAQCRSAVTG